MKTTLKPRFLESKQSKNGKTYFKLECHNDEKKYTIHEKFIADFLGQNFGKDINCEVITSDDGRWHNIRKIFDENPQSQSQGNQEISTSNINKGYGPKASTMLLSYAKDILIAGIEKTEEIWTENEFNSRFKFVTEQVVKRYLEILSQID